MTPARWFRRTPEPARWLVLDVESSGLDPARDRLLAIAAVAVRREGPRLLVDLDDSFEIVLRQAETAPDKANILIHGIGVATQRAGVPPAQALAAFATFAGAAPLIGFHSAFDRVLIDRATRAVLGQRLRNAWLDLADLAPVLCPGARARALDDWLAAFSITCLARHHAAADALATAELLQRLWTLAVAQGAGASFAALARLAAARRWLPG